MQQQPKKIVYDWKAAIKVSQLPPLTRFVLLNLSTYMSSDGKNCFPSIAQQVLDTGLSRSSIIRYLNNALEAGFLAKRKIRNGQQWDANSYQAIFPKFCSLPHSIEDLDNVSQTLPYDSESVSQDTLVVSDRDTNYPLNYPNKDIGSEKLPKKKKRNLVSLEAWEKEKGSELRIEMLSSWVKENKLCPVLVALMIKEFRTDMISGENQYANFVAAFQKYMNKGWLSKKMPQMLLAVSPYRQITQTRQTYGSAI